MFEHIPSLRNLVINAIWFKVTWIACVQMGNTAALALLPLTVLLHIGFIRLDRIELLFVFYVVFAGFVFDILLAYFGLVVFPGGSLVPPLWLVTIWLAFGTLIVVSLPYLARNLKLFSLLSAAMGMTSYWAGTTLSDAGLGYAASVSLPLLALAWGVMGLLLHLIYINTAFTSNKHYA